MLAQSWWLSCAQGLSQAALFKFQVDVLHIPLSMYYVLSSVMLGLQLPLAALAGRLSDRYGDRRPLMIALFAISPALLFHMVATPPTWWLLFGAYGLWGLFGVINVCGQNLALRLAPVSDNTVHLALFRQIGGLLAGVAGLCGGLWLDALLRESAAVSFGRVEAGGVSDCVCRFAGGTGERRRCGCWGCGRKAESRERKAEGRRMSKV